MDITIRKNSSFCELVAKGKPLVFEYDFLKLDSQRLFVYYSAKTKFYELVIKRVFSFFKVLSYWNAPELSFVTKFQGLFLRYTGDKTGNFSLSATVYARHI